MCKNINKGKFRILSACLFIYLFILICRISTIDKVSSRPLEIRGVDEGNDDSDEEIEETEEERGQYIIIDSRNVFIIIIICT